nr:protein tyrosine phosphatase-like protein [Naematelia aurantialba]
MSFKSSPSLAPNPLLLPSPPPTLGPLASVPRAIQSLRLLLLVTSINSFTQRCLAYFSHLGITYISVHVAGSDEDMVRAAERANADLVVCPFMTIRVPETVFKRWITLVVHPGPPGDAGPSSLDWMLLGDDGTSGAEALAELLDPAHVPTYRSHWGAIVFQANEHLDGGAVWAWEQYSLPSPPPTKTQVYQTLNSQAAITALTHAILRVWKILQPLPREEWMSARPLAEWETNSVTLGVAFLGGVTGDRPLLTAKQRRPDLAKHTAETVARIVRASDSQPGAQLAPLTMNSKTCLFAYGAQLHRDSSTIPAQLYSTLGFASWDEIPAGTLLARRNGAVFFKTAKAATASAGVWLTHGRVPKKAGMPLEPKVPMVSAILDGGHGSVLEGVREWTQDSWEEREGEWQEVRVRRVEEEGRVAMLVYWDFYNGAFSTENCQILLRALQWATAAERGNVKLLVLMGGHYFCNGIALNTIEHAASPPHETWRNINAIDDVVEFLVSDTHPDRSPFMSSEVGPSANLSLCERGIATIACLRGNAAAGGVALAAACDVVIAGRGVVLNPAYRAMGLHGSEFHSYSYAKRCGPRQAAAYLGDMLPVSSTFARQTGLIDIEIGDFAASATALEALCVGTVRSMLTAPASLLIDPATTTFRCAPWSSYNPSQYVAKPVATSLIALMCTNKTLSLSTRCHDFPPLLHYRNEELSQMLVDCFHPVRSQRYHKRRFRFIRKVKSEHTPTRYILSKDAGLETDVEETPAFDDAPGWTRGEEWGWVGLGSPRSLQTSESTRVKLFQSADPKMLPPLGEGSQYSSFTSLRPSQGSPVQLQEINRLESVNGPPSPALTIRRVDPSAELSFSQMPTTFPESSGGISLSASSSASSAQETVATPPLSSADLRVSATFMAPPSPSPGPSPTPAPSPVPSVRGSKFRQLTDKFLKRRSIGPGNIRTLFPQGANAGIVQPIGARFPPYVQPMIENADQVLFQCLYDNASVPVAGSR